MKKNLIFGLLSIALVGGLFSSMGETEAKKLGTSDKYKVIRVDGKIIFKRSNEDMKKGDIFLSGTALSFLSPTSRAAVISSLKGRFVLSASEKGQTKILPAANNISSRSGALLNMIDLQGHFKDNYLVLDRTEIEVGGTTFPMDENSFFYLSYEYKGEKVRKKLDYKEGNILVIDKEEIYKIDGEAIPVESKEMTIYYRDSEGSKKISTFKPVFPDLDELKAEITIILEEFSDKADEVKIQEVTAYLGEFYGKPQKENLQAWLTQEFGIE